MRILRPALPGEDKQINSYMNQKAYYNRALEDFARRELENSNKKSIKLPSGTISIKKQQPHYNYQDDTILEWLQEYCPDLVKTVIPEPKHSIDKKELKKRTVIDEGVLYLNGIEVPGVIVEIREDKFEVK